MSDIVRRKDEHLDIVLTRDVGGARAGNGLDGIHFAHVALPELALGAIDLTTTFLGKPLAAPLIISSMTGGPERAATINRAIAIAAQSLGLAFGVGSQRVAIEAGQLAGFGEELRRLAPDVPILANLGGAQIKTSAGLDLARRAVDMIGADGLIVHLNPLQEAVQAGGDTDWRGVLDALANVAAALPVPVIAKEIGAGLSGDVARQIWAAGVRILDVAGRGGTSWAGVEAERAPDARRRAVAAAFQDWGIPTARAIREVRAACPQAVVIGSGGIRDGVDVAKAIRLGADLVGQAAGVLRAALEGPDVLIETLSTRIDQLRVACFVTGSADLAALARAKLLAPETP